MKLTHMKNDFINFLNQLGVEWKFVINGLIGGAVWSLYKKADFWSSVRQIVIGGVVSGYTTPFILEHTSPGSAGFISFTLGIIGMVLIDMIYKWGVDKLKILFSNDKKQKP